MVSRTPTDGLSRTSPEPMRRQRSDPDHGASRQHENPGSRTSALEDSGYHPRAMAKRRRTQRVSGARVTARRSADPATTRLLPIVIAALAGVAILVFAVVSLLSEGTNATPGGSAVSGITCDRGEHNIYHVHSQLTLRVDGAAVPVPANVGVRPGVCLYWLHTHDATGLLHVEAPTQREFTLGQFFEVWGQPLGPDAVATHAVGEGQQIFAFVDGQPYPGDLRSIQLLDGRRIELQIGAAAIPPTGSSG
jgi:hypothetical protein